MDTNLRKSIQQTLPFNLKVDAKNTMSFLTLEIMTTTAKFVTLMFLQGQNTVVNAIDVLLDSIITAAI
jgi:hypothetical protein